VIVGNRPEAVSWPVGFERLKLGLNRPSRTAALAKAISQLELLHGASSGRTYSFSIADIQELVEKYRMGRS
jgi:hypothetical protein